MIQLINVSSHSLGHFSRLPNLSLSHFFNYSDEELREQRFTVLYCYTLIRILFSTLPILATLHCQQHTSQLDAADYNKIWWGH